MATGTSNIKEGKGDSEWIRPLQLSLNVSYLTDGHGLSTDWAPEKLYFLISLDEIFP